MNHCKSCLRPIYFGSDTHCQYCLDMSWTLLLDANVKRARDRRQCIAVHKRTGAICHNRYGHTNEHFAGTLPNKYVCWKDE